MNIELPTLEQRAGVIPILADHFLCQFLASCNKEILGFSPEAMELMQNYDWPGNIRELENCVERAVVLNRDPWITPRDLPPAVIKKIHDGCQKSSCEVKESLRISLQKPKKQIIIEALKANDGFRKATVDQLGISRTTLYKKMKFYQLLDK